jgi:hypothetical protein
VAVLAVMGLILLLPILIAGVLLALLVRAFS